MNLDDLVAILLAWGPCASSVCPADITRNGLVGVDDLIAVVNALGPCNRNP